MAVSSLIIQFVTLLELRRDYFCLNSLCYKIKVRKKSANARWVYYIFVVFNCELFDELKKCFFVLVIIIAVLTYSRLFVSAVILPHNVGTSTLDGFFFFWFSIEIKIFVALLKKFCFLDLRVWKRMFAMFSAELILYSVYFILGLCLLFGGSGAEWVVISLSWVLT